MIDEPTMGADQGNGEARLGAAAHHSLTGCGDDPSRPTSVRPAIQDDLVVCDPSAGKYDTDLDPPRQIQGAVSRWAPPPSMSSCRCS